MPTLEGYQYADQAHPKTVVTSDYRYTCASDLPRGRTNLWVVQDGWTEDGRRRMVQGATEWLPLPCGYIHRAQDPHCEGCKNRSE